jgi:Arc/MetJ-type ribon-helix-helix transcriptional regulator
MERTLIDSIDAWIARQPGPRLSRSEAIRRLVEEALSRELRETVPWIGKS